MKYINFHFRAGYCSYIASQIAVQKSQSFSHSAKKSKLYQCRSGNKSPSSSNEQSR